MGSQISVQEIEKKQESLNSILNNTLNKISTNISLKSENKQTVKIKADTLNISNKGKLNINQTASMNLDAFIKNVGETSSEVTQNVMNDFKYFKEMKVEDQRLILRKLKEVNEFSNVEKPYRLALLESNIPVEFKSVAMKKINILQYMDTGSGEYYKIKQNQT